jgi:DNA-binding transcriptional regulator WhiA
VGEEVEIKREMKKKAERERERERENKEKIIAAQASSIFSFIINCLL